MASMLETVCEHVLLYDRQRGMSRSIYVVVDVSTALLTIQKIWTYRAFIHNISLSCKMYKRNTRGHVITRHQVIGGDVVAK